MAQLSLEEKIYVFQNRIHILNKLYEMTLKLDIINIDPMWETNPNIDDAYFRLQSGIQDKRPFKEILSETNNLWKELEEQFTKINIDFSSETD